MAVGVLASAIVVPVARQKHVVAVAEIAVADAKIAVADVRHVEVVTVHPPLLVRQLAPLRVTLVAPLVPRIAAAVAVDAVVVTTASTVAFKTVLKKFIFSSSV